MSIEIITIIIKTVYSLCHLAFIVVPLYLLPYSIKKLKDWTITTNDTSLRKGCSGLIVSITFFIIFILLIIKRYHC